MNHALLAELQQLSAYPSVTLLHTTHPGAAMSGSDVAAVTALIDDADRRLSGDVDDELRESLVARLRELLSVSTAQRCTRAIAICVSPEHDSVIRLGREVRSRVAIDETFATRDMVADANRTATFRVITVSDRAVRHFVGDRARLAESRDDRWPMQRDDDMSPVVWQREVNEAIRAEARSFDVPTVVAGVTRSIREFVDASDVTLIGTVPGSHDRTGWPELHQHAWPMVVDWLRQDTQRAQARLVEARSARRYAGGIDEVWDLANDGRVQLLVVEDDYELAARLEDGHVVPADDHESPDVIDDVIDELIEQVLRMGGEAVLVPSGELAEHERLAAVLRF